jgi:hypothetical protein
MKNDGYIQIGVTALRDPATGGFLPAVPLFIKATPDATEAENVMLQDAARTFAGCFKKYVDGVGAVERRGRDNA